MLFDVTRPCLLNGIPEFAGWADLADRAIIVTLPVIAEERREYERLWREFEAARPRILAALLDAAASALALARRDTVELASRPRLTSYPPLPEAYIVGMMRAQRRDMSVQQAFGNLINALVLDGVPKERIEAHFAGLASRMASRYAEDQGENALSRKIAEVEERLSFLCSQDHM